MMNDNLLLGKPVSQRLIEQAKQDVLFLKEQTGKIPQLINILVGDNEASLTYAKRLIKRCEEIQIKAESLVLPENTSTSALVEKIKELNKKEEIHGILLQHPFPKHIQEQDVFEALDVKKDVDGVSPANFGRMAFGSPAHIACTPFGILKLLKHYQIPIEGKEAVVLGRSAILGKPMAMLLLAENATVTTCHSRTQNLPEIVKRADIVVAAIGKPHFIQADWLKKGVVVVDAGYTEGKGDVDFEAAKEIASYITPVPRGVGPVTIAILISQIISAFTWQNNISLKPRVESNDS